GHERWRSGEADQSRAARALVSHASSRPSGVAGRADGAHLRAEYRPRLEHRGGVHRPSPPQARLRLHRNRPRSRLQDRVMRSLRARVLIGSILWTLGLLALSHLMFLLFMHTHRFELRVRHDVLLYIALTLMIAGLVYLRTGVSSIDQLRQRLADVREGRSERLEGKYPSEVQPLVNDLNALIDE